MLMPLIFSSSRIKFYIKLVLVWYIDNLADPLCILGVVRGNVVELTLWILRILVIDFRIGFIG